MASSVRTRLATHDPLGSVGASLMTPLSVDDPALVARARIATLDSPGQRLCDFAGTLASSEVKGAFTYFGRPSAARPRPLPRVSTEIRYRSIESSRGGGRVPVCDTVPRHGIGGSGPNTQWCEIARSSLCRECTGNSYRWGRIIFVAPDGSGRLSQFDRNVRSKCEGCLRVPCAAGRWGLLEGDWLRQVRLGS